MIKRLLLVILLSVSAQIAEAQMQLRLVQQPATLHRLQQERQALQAQQDRRQRAFLGELDHLRSEDLQRRATLVQQESPQDHLQDLQQNQQLQIQLQQQQLQQQQQVQQQQLLQQHLQQQQPANLPPNPPAGYGR
ncbi:MAG: hypothetical protein KGI43_04215 [Alphaproteobacteria bacterium]|nr:hypothetical protein [Alphaproteobacteria bacterium]